MTTLKPCPFCGSEAKLIYNGPTEEQLQSIISWARDYDASWYVECTSCQAAGPPISGPEEAADAWDRRVA